MNGSVSHGCQELGSVSVTRLQDELTLTLHVLNQSGRSSKQILRILVRTATPHTLRIDVVIGDDVASPLHLQPSTSPPRYLITTTTSTDCVLVFMLRKIGSLLGLLGQNILLLRDYVGQKKEHVQLYTPHHSTMNKSFIPVSLIGEKNAETFCTLCKFITARWTLLGHGPYCRYHWWRISIPAA